MSALNIHQKPMFLVGQGLGATIALAMGLSFPNLFSGLVLANPLFDFSGFYNTKTCRMWLLSKLLWNYRYFQNFYSFNDQSKNPLVNEMWAESEKYYKRRHTFQTIKNLETFFKVVYKDCINVKVPYFLAQGGKDTYGNYNLSKRFMRHSKIEDRMFAYFVDM